MTGLSWDADGRRLIVYRIPGDADFDRDVLSRTSPEVTVLLVDVDRTLHEETREITGEVLAAHDLPIRVHGVGTHWSVVEVTGEGDIEAAQRVLDGRYGAGAVVVVRGGPHVRL